VNTQTVSFVLFRSHFFDSSCILHYPAMSSTNGTSALRVNVALSERDAVKLILDFLQQRELYISMLDIERETGMF
jgi:hypothetical protein